MKEVRYFYAPDLASTGELPPDEAAHAVRVLRLKEGDELLVTDGRGGLFRSFLPVRVKRKGLCESSQGSASGFSRDSHPLLPLLRSL